MLVGNEKEHNYELIGSRKEHKEPKAKQTESRPLSNAAEVAGLGAALRASEQPAEKSSQQ